MTADGLPLTTAVRSVTFEGRYAADVREAVVALDMAAYSDLVSMREVDVCAATLNGWTGVPQLRAAVPLADENSWSPEEVRTRLVWVIDAELPRPLCNVPIFDRSGHHLGTPDLLDAEAGVVVEYDGRLHLEGARRKTDRDRDDLYRRLGLHVVTVLPGDLGDRDRLAVRFRTAYEAAAFAAGSRREWVTEPPPWWTPTVTVEQRRNLDESERERVLRLRLRTA